MQTGMETRKLAAKDALNVIEASVSSGKKGAIEDVFV